MKFKLFLVISILIMSISIAYIITLLNQDFILSKETKYEATLNVWTTTPELSVLLQQFQDQTNIKVNVKQFQNPELLNEELELTKLNNNIPEIVEVSSDFGIADFKKEYDIKSLENLVNGNDFHISSKQLFSEDNNLYAFPLGIEVPVFYFNKTLLSDHLRGQVHPFQEAEVWKEYKAYQDKKNNGAANRQFWFFHFDESTEWYRDAYVSAAVTNTVADFESNMKLIQAEYELVPPFDSPMAITRFVSFEVGALITSSKHIQTIQQLIGNRFEFEVTPFIENPQDKILIAGKGLAVMDLPEVEDDDIRLLLEYLNTKEVQLQLLGSTGTLPSQKKLLRSHEFLQGLPMGKYLLPLADFNANFIGRNDKKTVEVES